MLGVCTHLGCVPIGKLRSTPLVQGSEADKIQERQVITEDGSALVMVPTTISLVEFVVVLLLSILRSQSTSSMMRRRSWSLVRGYA
jgi:hypothetical protein